MNVLDLTDKELYHIHTLQDKSKFPNRHTLKWIDGNILSFGGEVSSETNLLHDRIFNPYINLEGEINLIKRIAKERLNTKTSNLKDNLQETFLQKGFMFKYYQLTREIVLEEVRKSSFPEKPSRLNGIWLTDKAYLDIWLRQIPSEQFPQKIYLVKFSGKAHRADGRWITNPTLSFEKIYQNAIGYWTGEDKSKRGKPNAEFICNGSIEIISEVQSHSVKI